LVRGFGAIAPFQSGRGERCGGEPLDQDRVAAGGFAPVDVRLERVPPGGRHRLRAFNALESAARPARPMARLPFGGHHD